MKAVKGQLQLLMSALFTLMIIMVLFVIIFVVFDKQEPDAQFWTELITTSVLAISAKITWYSSAESNRMEEADIVTAKDKYFRYVDDNVTDIKDFDAFLVVLNQERREKYITRKMGSRTPENCKNYDKLLLKYQRKADKLKETEQQFIETLKPTYNQMNAKGLNIERHKEYKKEYMKEYQKLDKVKESHRKACNKYDNQLCCYNGKTLTLCALKTRFWRRGIDHPSAEAKKYLIKN